MTGGVPILAVALVGSVDNGKSTLLGRLMHDAGVVPSARVTRLEAESRLRGADLEWSFLLDSLQAERDQAVTIDTSEVRIAVADRALAFIDAPGHIEFLGNLVTGAARADAAVLVVDGADPPAPDIQRHSTLLKLLGVEDIVVAINKIDLCRDRDAAFVHAAQSVRAHLRTRGLDARAVVPTIARTGANVLSRSDIVPGYSGPSLVEVLLGISPRRQSAGRPLRLPVQDVYRRGDARLIAGRLATGQLRRGDSVLVLPSGQAAIVEDIHPPRLARAGDNVAVRLSGNVFGERGHVIVDPAHAPKLTRVFDADVFWLDAAPLVVGSAIRVRLSTSDIEYRVQAIRWRLDDDGTTRVASDRIDRFDMGGVTLRTSQPQPVDDGADFPATARFVALRGTQVAGIGIASTAGYPDLGWHARPREPVPAQSHAVTRAERALRYGHSGMVVWLTGLSGAGKSTLAMDLERRLLGAGCAAYVLDGDNLRQGLNADLGFARGERRENVRRAGEVAALFADAGLVCIVALISPYRDDRDRARAAARVLPFCEVFVDAPLEVCEARDPKGLYRKVRAAELKGFTGIDAPYERPESSDLVLRTGENSVEVCASTLFEFVRDRLGLAR